MRKGFAQILILGLAVAVLVLMGAFYLGQMQKPQSTFVDIPKPSLNPLVNPASSSSADIANWKTYTGKNFSFKYPGNWLTDNNQIYDSSTMFKGGNGGSVVMYKTQLWFTEVDSKLTLDQYIAQYYGNQTSSKMNNISVNELKARSFYNPIGEGTPGWYVAFTNGSNIVLFGPQEKDITQDKILNTIINSFNFTN